MSEETTSTKASLSQEDLYQFTGTEEYHRLSLVRSVVFTDGMAYVAMTGKAFWLMDAIASHLIEIYARSEPFVAGKLTRDLMSSGAVLRLEDGNGKILRQQEIEHTDFPLAELDFYASHDGTMWVVMLTSEY